MLNRIENFEDIKVGQIAKDDSDPYEPGIIYMITKILSYYEIQIFILRQGWLSDGKDAILRLNFRSIVGDIIICNSI